MNLTKETKYNYRINPAPKLTPTVIVTTTAFGLFYVVHRLPMYFQQSKADNRWTAFVLSESKGIMSSSRTASMSNVEIWNYLFQLDSVCGKICCKKDSKLICKIDKLQQTSLSSSFSALSLHSFDHGQMCCCDWIEGIEVLCYFAMLSEWYM